MRNEVLFRYLVVRNWLAGLARQDEGVETLEVIAIMAILVILLGFLSTVFQANGKTIAQNVIDGIIKWSEGVKGQ